MNDRRVARLPPSANWTADQALHDALSQGLDQVVVIGDRGNGLFVRSGGNASRKDALWLVEVAKRHILDR